MSIAAPSAAGDRLAIDDVLQGDLLARAATRWWCAQPSDTFPRALPIEDSPIWVLHLFGQASRAVTSHETGSVSRKNARTVAAGWAVSLPLAQLLSRGLAGGLTWSASTFCELERGSA